MIVTRADQLRSSFGHFKSVADYALGLPCSDPHASQSDQLRCPLGHFKSVAGHALCIPGCDLRFLVDVTRPAWKKHKMMVSSVPYRVHMFVGTA